MAKKDDILNLFTPEDQESVDVSIEHAQTMERLNEEMASAQKCTEALTEMGEKICVVGQEIKGLHNDLKEFTSRGLSKVAKERVRTDVEEIVNKEMDKLHEEAKIMRREMFEGKMLLSRSQVMGVILILICLIVFFACMIVYNYMVLHDNMVWKLIIAMGGLTVLTAVCTFSSKIKD